VKHVIITSTHSILMPLLVMVIITIYTSSLAVALYYI
jgi:hypothetical protein